MMEYKKGLVEIGPSGQKLLHCPHEGCDKVLTSSPGLRYHMRTHCGNDRPYLCNRCKKTFKSANGLKYHTEKTKCELMIDMTSIHHIDVRMQSRNEESIQDDDVEVDVVSTSQPLDIQNWRQSAVHDGSNGLTLSPSPYKNRLDISDQDEIVNPLTQLAIIATGPHSPLLHANLPLTDFQKASQTFNASIHSYAKPPRSKITSPVISRKRSLSFSGPESKYSSSTSNNSSCSDDDGPLPSESTNSELELDPISTSSDENNGSEAGSEDNHCEEMSWPEAKWQCFISGTKVRIENGIITDWKRVEDRFEEKYLEGSYAPHGLRLVEVLAREPMLHLAFSPEQPGGGERATENDSVLFAQCQLDHPFFVKDKGWCSCHPSLTDENYGIPCSSLDINDVCLPSHHPDASFTRSAVRSLNSLQFTPEDSHAVFALSQMARSRKKSNSSEQLSSSFPRSSMKPAKKRPSSFFHDHLKAKRPMNAFMLFAQKYRLHYTQLHPGKDNRAISVLLGDHWKKMKNDERKGFSQEAKKLAEQFRKKNPDCWKRKRSVSEGFIS
ncbi:HMG box-containing protein 1-like [Watersipora subatra]|uniref:HMG box-containing protein 1-like n=1 Tax=Watersipora subatra TaxID=2589382 RepID=UPI00355C3AB8